MTADLLNDRGREVYAALTGGRDLNAVQKMQALNVARMADQLDRIATEMEINPALTVVNGQGTTTVNPLIAEARQITSALTTILAKMGISELPEAKGNEKSALDEIAERRRARSRGAAPEDSLHAAGDN